MSTSTKADRTNEFLQVLRSLFDAQYRFGTEILKAVSQAKLLEGESCCDIPEPCWMPLDLGEVVSIACPSATAVMRLIITNCDRVPRTISVEAAGDAASFVALDTTPVTLGPKERGVVTATLKIPPDAAINKVFEVLLWVRGSRQHFLRWNVTVSKSGADCCHEVKVEDCPDFVHHWYDHFYCVRPEYYRQPEKIRGTKKRVNRG